MARLLENQALDLLQQGGMSVPRYEVASSPEEARDALEVVLAMYKSSDRGERIYFR